MSSRDDNNVSDDMNFSSIKTANDGIENTREYLTVKFKTN